MSNICYKSFNWIYKLGYPISNTVTLRLIRLSQSTIPATHTFPASLTIPRILM